MRFSVPGSRNCKRINFADQARRKVDTRNRWSRPSLTRYEPRLSQHCRRGRYVACDRLCTGNAEHQVRQYCARRDHTVAIGASRAQTNPSHSRALVEEMNELERGRLLFGLQCPKSPQRREPTQLPTRSFRFAFSRHHRP